MLTYGSLFSGVGGFDMGFDNAGYECRWQVEWDTHCQQTLQYHWPDVPKYLDVQNVDGSLITPVDVIIYGSPCQDLSVAGKRAGLDGQKSSMFFESIRIFKEMRDATGGLFPRIAIWENVPGALSSNGGKDFEAVLTTLGDAGALAQWWSVLDAQFFGVPQRRRRVFLVSVFDSGIARAIGDEQVLAVGTGIRGNPQENNTAKQGTTGLPEGTAGESIIIFSHTQGLDPQPSTVASPTLRSNGSGMAVAYPHNGEGVLRRLSPLECERLMGWPDNHTLHRIDGKTHTQSTRFKMCGNGVATPVAQWVAEQVKVNLLKRSAAQLS